MANITRIKNNQITDATITFAKIASGTLTGALFNPALTLNSNVTILGNLSVTGNTSTINSTNTYVNDPLIVFNNGYTGSPTYDIGMIANRNLQNLAGYGSVNTAFVWKEADASFQAITTTETGTTTGSITNSGWANVKVGNLTALTTTTGGLQAVAIGNVTPGTAAFTTGTFSSTLGVTGATTLTTATAGGLQVVAIGNVTPGTGVFTTGTFNTTTTGGLQAVAIGNVTPGTGVFTTGTFDTATAGGLQAVAIGNVTPGTSVFTTTSTGGLQAQAIGNVTPGTGAFTTATAGGLQAQAIGNVTPGTGVFTTGTFNTATAGGLQAQAIGNVTPGTGVFVSVQAVAIGNVTPGTGVFTTGAFNTATAGGLQAQAIGNVTPGTGVFTTGTFDTATAGGLQAVAIGNVTPGTGVFTTGTFNTATTGGLQAVAIGNVTPGTAAFTTATAGSFQGIVGNTAATTAFFTTANATNVYAATIGNASTSLNGSIATITNWANITGTTAATSTTTGALIVAGGVGVAGNIYSGYTLTAANIVTSGSNGNISGVSNLFTANVIATNVNAVTIGNTGSAITGNTGTLTSLQVTAIGNVTPGTGVFTTGAFNTATAGGLQAVAIGNVTPGTGAFTTATAGSFQGIIGNATATTAFFTTANATTVNAATIGNIGAVLKGDGGLISNISLGSISGTYPTANVAMYENIATTTTNAVYYAYLADKASGNVAAVVATGVNVNPSTSTVSALAFVGGTGAFTTLSASGATTVTDATQSTSSGTGALVVTGGAGIGANLYVGGNTTIIGNLTVVGTTTAVQSTTLDVSDLNITVAKGASTAAAANGAGLTVDGAGATLTYLNATDTWNFNKGLVGTTITTGGLQAVAIGNATPGTAAFTTVTAGSLQGIIGNASATTAFFTTANATNVYAATVGNASTTLNGNLIGGNANLTSTTAATSTTTGALQVAGGAGVAGNVYVGGSLVTTGASGNISGVNTVFTTTVNATNVYAVTIGNIGASVVGNGGFLSNIIGANVVGTVPTANVAMYENVATSTTNAVYYPQLADKASGNVASVVATGVNVNPSTSTISALSFVGGTGSFTTGAFSSTLGVTGATTMTTATVGGLQAQAIGNVTPGTGVFVSVQAVAIGNVTPGTGAFTTASTTGNLTVGGNIAVTGNIVPSANIIYSLGTSGNRFKDIYLSGQTQYIGGSVIGEDESGNLSLTTATGNRLTISSIANVVVTTGNITAPYHLGNAYGTTGTFLGSDTSTSTTTGAVVVTGGAGIGGNLFVGGLASIAGAVTIGGNTAVNSTLYGRGVYDNGVQVVSTSTGAGNLTISTGGINLTPVGPGAVTTGDATSIPVITTDAYGRITSISTAAVAAVAGAANVALHVQTVALSNNATFYPTFSNVNGSNSIPGTSSLLTYNASTGNLVSQLGFVSSNQTSTSTTSGALQVVGGAGIGGNVHVGGLGAFGGTITTTDTTASTSTTTGALQVAGGAGIAGNLRVGQSAIFNTTQTAGMDVVARGANDTTLIWARPSASYDTVIIGNSATASTVVAGAKLNINTTDSIKLPVGTNAQRPGNQGQSDVQGMFRYSSTQNAVEWYTGTQWIAATTTFTVITDEQFNGDGSTVAFTLAGATTTASTIVSINGVMQIPTLAYAVSGGTTLTFTEAPASGDIIDVRRLTTTETVIALTDATGYNAVDVDNVDGVTISTGTATKAVRFRINTDGAQVSLLANTAIASANVATTIDTMATGTYRSAKYTVQATNGASYQVLEALLISNGTTATVMAYGTIQTAGNLGIVTATQSGSNALLQFTALSSSTNVRITKEYLLI